MLPKKYSALGMAVQGIPVSASSLKGVNIIHKPTEKSLKSAVKRAGKEGRVVGVYTGPGKSLRFKAIKKKSKRRK